MFAVVDDDDKLDDFLKRLDTDRKREMAKSRSRTSTMSKDAYVAKQTRGG